MKDQRKTKAQLIKELEALRQQVADLQAVTSEHQQLLEEGLCQSEERYRDLFENASDALATFTLDGTLTAVNRGLEILTGWSREDLIGQDYRKITPLAVIALTEERTRRTLVGEKLLSTFEAGFVCKDGRVVPVEARTRFIRDKEGRPIDLQITARDIAARKRAEEALRESEQRYRHLFETANDGISIISRDGCFLEVNQKLAEFTGLSREEIIGKTTELFLPGGFAQSLERIEQTIQEGKLGPFELEITTPLGKRVGSFTASVYHEGGVPVGVINIVRDITERHRRRQEREALYQLAHDLVRASDVPTIADHLFRQTKRLLGSDYASLMLANATGTELRRVAVSGMDNQVFHQERVDVATELAPATVVFQQRTSLVIPDVASSTFMSPRIREQYGFLRGAWFVPLMSGTNAIGTFCVAYATSRDATPEDLRLLQLLSYEAALALERVRLTEDLREKEEQLRTVVSHAPIVLWASDRSGIFTLLEGKGLEALGCKSGEYVGQSIFDVYRDVPRALEDTRHALAGETFTSTGEVAGSVFESWYSPLRDREGNIVGTVGVATDITERRQTEEALQQSEQKYHTLVDRIRDGVFIIPDGKVQFCNDALASMLGYTVDELTGRDMREIVAPEDVELVMDRYRRRLAGEAIPQCYEFHMLHKDKSTRIPVELSVTLVTSQGKPATMGTIRDITERKRTEAALRASQERQSLILRSLPMAFYTAEAYGDSGARWVSDQIDRISGFSPQRFIETSHFWASRLHPDDRERVLKENQTALDTGALVTEYRWQHADGSYRWFLDQATLIRDEAGGPKEVIGTWLDITERKRAEEALRASEERYHELFENANDLVYTHDLAGYFTSLNRAGEQITGYARDEALTLNVSHIVAPEYRELARQMTARKVAQGSPTVYELEIVTKDGRKVPLEVSTRLIYLAGQPVEVQGIARDITERKQAEEERQQLQRQLFQAQKLESVGTLAGGIAHDFNNILAAILGFTELVTDEVPDGTRARRNLEEVLKASRRAKGLVQQLLTFSRPHNQGYRPIHLQPIVEEVLTFLRALPTKTIAIHPSIDTLLAPVLADPTQIQQVLTNLCMNAAQAMEEKGGVLEVSLTRAEVDGASAHILHNLKPGPHVHLTVRDTGCGMTPQVMQRIFDPFFTTKPVGQGSGLGLSIVHRIVANHGGAITVESQLGEGTMFHVYLPLSENIALSENAPHQSSSPALGGASPANAKGEFSHATHSGH